MKHTYEPERKVETLVKSRMANGQGHETASCYYGKVQAELLFPLAEGEIKEDNCSACVRVSFHTYHLRICPSLHDPSDSVYRCLSHARSSAN